ncbi:phage tail tape measure protein [Clostridium gasigenes]|uniref:Phage tail tape measure protein, TP901 family, core region n=1 Tax=Clostridium gasigenes TaxID=94869 RepID=A0A1H0N6L1_9CLOT|nr:phage tail tape measure protein [Clostridium gasigenes]SDO88261.1 phage tail tape measure protein, TP901 family, core region [Clostridium gasigenes]
MSEIGVDLGSIHSSLDLRLDKFEGSVTKALAGFYKMQTSAEKSSSIMDKSVYTAVSNIEKSYKIWENANNSSGKSLENNSKKIDAYKSSMKLLDVEINKSEKTLADIEKQCGKNSKEYENFKSHVLDLKIKHSELSKELEKTSKTTYNVAENMERLDESYKKTSIQMSNIEKGYKLFNLTQDKTGKGIFDNSKKVDALKEELNLLEGTIKKHESLLKAVEKEYGKNSKQAEEYKSKVLDLKIAHVELGKDLKVVTKETTTLAGKLDILGKEFSKIDDKYRAFDKIGNSLTNLGSKLTMGVTLPLVGMGTVATKLFGDFEHGTSKISTIADTTKLSMDQISEGVKNLSTTTGVSTNDLNEALYETLSAGVDTSKSIDFLDVAVKAAKGGFTDTTTAVDGLTSVLNSYGLTADKANDIANQMLITQNLGKTTFGELASAVGKVTPVSAALGITTNELFSSLASTTSQGLATSESVTALKAAMSNIIKPTKEAGEAAQTLGIDFSVSSLQSKGWIGFLGDLKTGLQKASPEFDKLSVTFGNNAMKMLELEKTGKKTSAEYKNLQKENKSLNKELELLAQAADSPIGAMATMFGSVEGLNSILMLTSDQGMKIYDDSMKQMTENTEALEDAYKKMSNTSTEKFAIQLNKLKIAGIEMGNKLMPLAEKGVKFLGDLAEGFSNLTPSTQEWIVKAGLATAALGPLTSAIGGTFKVTGDLLKTGKKVGTFFGLFKAVPVAAGAVKGLGTATTITTGSMAGLGAVALPLTLAVAAVGGAIYATQENNEMLSKSCNVASEELSGMERVMATLGGVTLNTKEEMSAMGIKYGEWNKNISPETQAALTDITEKIGTLKLEIANGSGIENFISTADGIQVQQQASELIEGVKKNIEEKTPEVQTKLKELFNSDGIIDEEEQKTLAAMDNGNKNKLIKLEEHNVKFKELSIKMEKESGDAKIATRKLIDEELDAIGEIGRQATVKNEEEDLASRADFNTRIKGLDVTALSEIMVEKAKMRDENVAKETLDYNTMIEAMRLSLEGKNEIETTYIKGSIAKLEKQRDDSIQKENEKYAGYLKIAAEGNSQIGTSMDLHNGEMLTKAEKAKREQLLEYGSRMEGLLGITTTGWYNVKNTTDGKMHETFVSVDEKTGMIEGVWDATTKSIIGKPITAEERIDHPKIASAFNTIEGNYDGVKDSILRNGVEVEVKETSNPFGWLTAAWSIAKWAIGGSPLSVGISGGGVQENWTGTDNFSGGLTTMHERGYELYNLGKGSKIWNHDASEAMVMESARQVATEVARSVVGNMNTSSGGDIIIPISIAGEEIDRIIVPRTSNRMALNTRGRR